jgi:hypothetical protein
MWRLRTLVGGPSEIHAWSMKRIACVLFLAACANSGGDDYPVNGVGGGPVGGVGGGGGGGNLLRGRVCLLGDLISGGNCSNSGAGGLTVSMGGNAATTGADGSFAITPPAAGTAPSFVVSGPGMVPSVSTPAPNATGTIEDVSLPIIRQDLFSRMMSTNGVVPVTGSGSIVSTIVRGGTPVSGVTGVSTPSPAFGPFFDGTTPTAWTLNGTGARGVVWFPGVSVGPASVTFTDAATTSETTVDGIQVIDGGVTFMDAILP